MSFYNYIKLGTKQYRTVHKKWAPITHKPETIRKTLLGVVDVTFGAGRTKEWNGVIEALPSTDAVWGCIADLRALALQKTTFAFQDHYGAVVQATFAGNISEESLMAVWDDANNIFYVTVRLIS